MAKSAEVFLSFLPCSLEGPGDAQGCLFPINTLGQQYFMRSVLPECNFLLFTNNHVIRNRFVLKKEKWKLRFGEGIKQKFQLSSDNVLECSSCCDKNGILEKCGHPELEVNGEIVRPCPQNSDFTVLFLCLNVRKMKALKYLQEVDYCSLVHNTVSLSSIKDLKCCIRGKDGKVIMYDLNPPSNDDPVFITPGSFMQQEDPRGSSGAVIVSCDRDDSGRVKYHPVAMHVSTSYKNNVPVEQTHISLPWIIQLIALSNGTYTR